MKPLELGDMIECKVQNPYPRKLQVILSTPEALTYGRYLVATGRWWKVEAEK